MNSLSPTLAESTLAFKGARFDVRTVYLDDGKVQRDAVIHPGAVIILPIVDDNTLVMIQNRRFIVNENLWELPAGTLEPEEAPHLTAARELREEAGYEADEIMHLTSFYTSPGICNEIMHAYAAKGLKHVGQDLDSTEEILVKNVTWLQALHMIQDGTIKDGKTIATLLFYYSFNIHKI